MAEYSGLAETSIEVKLIQIVGEYLGAIAETRELS